MVATGPILLEECTRQEIPSSLDKLIAHLYETTAPHKEVTKLELIGSLVYILMLEMGYTPTMKPTYSHINIDEQFVGDVSFNKKRMQIFCQYPRNWQVLNTNCIEMHYFLIPCQQTFDIIVSMTTFGTGITLNLIIMNNVTQELEHLFPYFIPTVKYILNANAPVEKKFNNLRELSTDFKNKVAYPAKCTILNTDYKKHACLQYLPYELLVRISTYLSLQSFASFIQTCKHLNQVSDEQFMWKMLCRKTANKYNIRSIYKNAIKKEKNGDKVDWRVVCKESSEFRPRTSYFT